MFIFVVGEPHHHCDFCSECLTEGVPFLRYRCGDIWIERRDGGSPDLYGAGEWKACVACAVCVEDRDVNELVERMMIALETRTCDHNRDDLREEARRLIASFDALREKTNA